jgi:hypothetical protein
MIANIPTPEPKGGSRQRYRRPFSRALSIDAFAAFRLSPSRASARARPRARGGATFGYFRIRVGSGTLVIASGTQ